MNAIEASVSDLELKVMGHTQKKQQNRRTDRRTDPLRGPQGHQSEYCLQCTISEGEEKGTEN